MKDVKVSSLSLIEFAERFNLWLYGMENVRLAYKIWCTTEQLSVHTEDDIVAAIHGGNTLEGPIEDCFDINTGKSFTGYAVHLVYGDTRSDDYTDNVVTIITEDEYRKDITDIHNAVDMVDSHITMEVTVKQVRDLCNLIVEIMSAKNLGEYERWSLNCALEVEFDCFPETVKDHVRNIMLSQATNRQL